MKSAALKLELPGVVREDLPTLSADLSARMHQLLEQNTEGALSVLERRELETLIQMAQFAQILALAAQQAATT